METKKCENCSFYSECFYKRSTSFEKALYGCCNKTMNPKESIKPNNYVCKQWKYNIIIKEERNKSIKDKLLEISNQLIEISSILKDEEN